MATAGGGDKLNVHTQLEHLHVSGKVGGERAAAGLDGGGGRGRARIRPRPPPPHPPPPAAVMVHRVRPRRDGGARKREIGERKKKKNADPLSTPLPPSPPSQSKVVGTGHADTTRFEWAVNMHRDTAASFLGHPHLASYLAVAEGESLGRVRYRLRSKMVAPGGVPPKRADE